MKYQSSIISSGSGSIAGCTYSRNKAGNYIRNRTVPVNPQTSFQSTVRSSFGGLAQAWSTSLDAAERAAWDAYAAAVTVPSFNGPIHITGMNWFIAINTPRLQAGLARIDAAPATQTGTTLTPLVLTAYSIAGSEFDVTISGADEWATVTGGHLFVYAGGPRNATRNFFKGPYRFMQVVNGNTTTPPSGSTPLVTGPVAAVGQRVYLRAFAQALDGRMSVSQAMSIIASA
jgi:hypothetical protein